MSFLSKIIYQGVDNAKDNLEARSVKLCNQLNLYVLVLSFIGIVFLVAMGLIENAPLGIGTLRVVLVLLLSVLNLLLSRFNYYRLARILTIFLPPFVFLILPSLIGFIEAESFTYYSYIAIAFSIIPQFLLLSGKDKKLYLVSFVYFLLYVLFIEAFLMVFLEEEMIIVDEIKSFFPYMKIVHLSVFLFINLSVLYLRRLNIEFEEDLIKVNRELEKYALELSNKNQALDESKKVLELSNSELIVMQNDIKGKNKDLHRALLNLKNAQNKLIQSEKLVALGTLTAGVAHEINNPLNFISGGIGIIDSELEDISDTPIDSLSATQSHDFIKTVSKASYMINEGVKKSTRIVNALRIYSFKDSTEMELVDLNEIIESTLLFLKAKMDSNIKLELLFNLSQEILAFPEKLHQVFLNVLDNAIYAVKKASNTKIIYISTSVESIDNKSFAKISIVNTGAQIEEEVLSNIFNPFYTTKKPGEGTGLGLSISYSIINEHKGEIELLNVSEGVECIIHLPL